MIQCYHNVSFWLKDPVLALAKCLCPPQFYNIFVGILISSLLLVGGILLYWGLNPLANRKEDKIANLILGGITIALTTIPMIRIQLSEPLFVLGCLIPPSIVSVLSMLFEYGTSRSAARAFKIQQSFFFILLFPCVPLWAARFVYWYYL